MCMFGGAARGKVMVTIVRSVCVRLVGEWEHRRSFV